jgi:hypothetical protein
MSLLRNSKTSDKTTWNYLLLFSLIGLNWLDIGGNPATAQPITTAIFPSKTCQQLTSRRYAVILDRPATWLPQLPDFLSTTAIPCRYLNTSMTFFGSFENLESSLVRAKQLSQLGLDTSIHSFIDRKNNDSKQFRSSALLVELPVNPNLAIQEVRALTGKTAFFATFNNRSVILASPLTNQRNASLLAYKLRNHGFATQLISAVWIDDVDANSAIRNAYKSTKSLDKTTPNPYFSKNYSTRKKPQILYRLLIPLDRSSQIKQAQRIFPDAFQRNVSGRSYIQVRSYLDRQNAHRERDRLNINFPEVILEAEKIYD